MSGWTRIALKIITVVVIVGILLAVVAGVWISYLIKTMGH